MSLTRMKRPGKNGDKIAIAMLAAFLLFVCLLPFLPPPKHPFNWGFSSRWTCANQSLEVTCQRR
jgi:hypothetical protein